MFFLLQFCKIKQKDVMTIYLPIYYTNQVDRAFKRGAELSERLDTIPGVKATKIVLKSIMLCTAIGAHFSTKGAALGFAAGAIAGYSIVAVQTCSNCMRQE